MSDFLPLFALLIGCALGLLLRPPARTERDYRAERLTARFHGLLTRAEERRLSIPTTLRKRRLHDVIDVG